MGSFFRVARQRRALASFGNGCAMLAAGWLCFAEFEFFRWVRSAPGAILSRREATPLFSLAGVHNGFVFSSRQAAARKRAVASFGNGWMMLAAGCEFSRSVRLASGCSDHLAGGALVFWQRSRDATGQIGLFRKYSDAGKRRLFCLAGLHNRFVFSSGQAAGRRAAFFLLGTPSRREAALMQVLFAEFNCARWVRSARSVRAIPARPRVSPRIRLSTGEGLRRELARGG